MSKSRTEIGVVEQYGPTDKWFVGFKTYRSTHAGDEYLASEVTSGAVFDTEDEAYAGGSRALTVLEQTGRFPNMCERF